MNSQHGAILMITIFILLLISTLSLASLRDISTNLKLAQNFQSHVLRKNTLKHHLNQTMDTFKQKIHAKKILHTLQRITTTTNIDNTRVTTKITPISFIDSTQKNFILKCEIVTHHDQQQTQTMWLQSFYLAHYNDEHLKSLKRISWSLQ